MTLSSYIVLGDFRKNGPRTPKVIVRKLLNAFSDQQIIEVSAVVIETLSTMIAAGLSRPFEVEVY